MDEDLANAMVSSDICSALCFSFAQDLHELEQDQAI
jgi:hypothetical protein